MPTVSTPHARGSTLVDFLKRTLDLVYPACAGIHLYKRLIGDHFVRLPRMRGDPPRVSAPSPLPQWSTPHARGSTVRYEHHIAPFAVYPACAGIHRRYIMIEHLPISLPCMRGIHPP